MAQLIDKSILVAEIEKRLEEYRTYPDYQIDSNYMELCDILSFINTIEVKEVDLEKELKEFLKDGDVGFKEIAIHFFKLGLQFKTETNIMFKYNIGESIREYKTQKGEEV